MNRSAPLLACFFLSSCMPLVGQKASTGIGSAPSVSDQQTFTAAATALRANHMDEAIAGFQRLTRKNPQFAEAYLNLGLALAQEARNEEAVAALEKSVSVKPGLRGAHLFLAISQYKLARLELASVAARKETTLNPVDAQAWMWQGIIDLALGHLAIAVEDLDRAAALDAKNVDILYHRGRAALALSRQSYETMFALDPQSWHVHQVLAEADNEQGKDDEAVDEYKLAIASAPPQSGLFEALGSAFWRTGKFQDAESAYEKALQIDPNDTLTMYKLGCLRVDRGDAAGGKPLLDRVLVADPSLKLASYYMGRAEAELGDDRAAVEVFRKVIAENVDDDTTKQAYFQLSRAYRRLHDAGGAAAAQAEYRVLDERGKDMMQAKLTRRGLRSDRDTSIPAPKAEPAEAQP